jgi:hypothetical protein
MGYTKLSPLLGFEKEARRKRAGKNQGQKDESLTLKSHP